MGFKSEMSVKVDGMPVGTTEEKYREFIHYLFTEKQKTGFLGLIALEFAFVVKEKYPETSIFWVSCVSDNSMVTISKYLDFLQGAELDAWRLLSKDVQDSTQYGDSKNSISKTWAASFKQMEKGDPQAAYYLSFIACLRPTPIPHSIFPRLEPESDMQSALNTLANYFFLATQQAGAYNLHRLVHFTARNLLREQGRLDKAVAEVIRHLASRFPDSDERQQEKRTTAIYVSHCIHALEIARSLEILEREEAYFDLCDSVGEHMFEEDDYPAAIAWLSISTQWRLEHWRDHHKPFSFYHLAHSYAKTGHKDRAIEMYMCYSERMGWIGDARSDRDRKFATLHVEDIISGRYD